MNHANSHACSLSSSVSEAAGGGELWFSRTPALLKAVTLRGLMNNVDITKKGYDLAFPVFVGGRGSRALWLWWFMEQKWDKYTCFNLVYIVTASF